MWVPIRARTGDPIRVLEKEANLRMKRKDGEAAVMGCRRFVLPVAQGGIVVLKVREVLRRVLAHHAVEDGRDLLCRSFPTVKFEAKQENAIAVQQNLACAGHFLLLDPQYLVGALEQQEWRAVDPVIHEVRSSARYDAGFGEASGLQKLGGRRRFQDGNSQVDARENDRVTEQSLRIGRRR